MKLYELIYTSVATDNPDIDAILSTCIARNAQFDITGCLVYDPIRHTFIQLFEGPEAAVDQLYRNIEADSRHSNVYLLHRGVIGKRSFPDWQMRYVIKRGVDIGPNVERQMFAYLWQNPGLRVLERVNQFKATERHEDTPAPEGISVGLSGSSFDRDLSPNS